MDLSVLSDMLVHVAAGTVAALSPTNIVMMFVGMAVGIIGGMLPGITTITTLALFIPFTFVMPPSTALIALGAVYCGSTYGGSNAAVLLNTPGQPGNIATALDGYAMTKQGKAKIALYVSLFASVFGGVFGGLMLLLFFEPLSSAALKFGSEAFFWMSIFGLSTLAALFPGQTLNGLLSGCLGMALSTIGMDLTTGVPRFTFGLFELQAGLDMVVLMIALFSISQMYVMLEGNEEFIAKVGKYPGAFFTAFKETFRHCGLMSVSSLIGTFIGILPGAGGSISSIVAYNEAKRWDKHPERYGTGVVEGVAAPESANNACVGGSLVPLLALGIPGSAAAAVLAGGLMAQGLTPGPQLLEKTPDIAYTFISSLILVNFVMIPVGWALANVSTRILDVPKLTVIPSVITLSCIGTYSLRNSLFDVLVMFLAGGLSYMFLKARLQPVAIALGLMLGPIVEENLVTTLFRAQALDSVSSLLIFSPLALVFIIATVLVIGLAAYMNHRTRDIYSHDAFGLNPHLGNLLHYDALFTLGIGVCSAVLLIQSFGFSDVSRIYPVFVFSTILTLSLLIVVSRIFVQGRVAGVGAAAGSITETAASADGEEAGSAAGRPWWDRTNFKVAVYFLITLGSYLGIDILGFYTSMFLCMLLMLIYGALFVSKHALTAVSLLRMIAVTLVVIGAQYLCFNVLLDVITPGGLWL